MKKLFKEPDIISIPFEKADKVKLSKKAKNLNLKLTDYARQVLMRDLTDKIQAEITADLKEKYPIIDITENDIEKLASKRGVKRIAVGNC